MKKILFVDLNNSLVEKVKAIGVAAEYGDYFHKSLNVSHPVLMTASNPHWGFGGGIDALFSRYFPLLVGHKQAICGGNERIGNINFCITVDNSYKADKETIKKAILFSISNLLEGETLLLSGVGTGIGGLSEEEFINVLWEILNTKVI